MITGIPSYEVRNYWGYLAPLISKPLKRMHMENMYSLDDVMEKLESRNWQCWVSLEGKKIECVFITKIDVYPAGLREVVVYLVGGTNLKHWLKEAWSLFREYGIANSCSKIRGMGREGWTRVIPDKIEIQTTFVAEL